MLAFGVKKVVWIYTDLQSVLIAEEDKDWQILNWDKKIILFKDLEINISEVNATYSHTKKKRNNIAVAPPFQRTYLKIT